MHLRIVASFIFFTLLFGSCGFGGVLHRLTGTPGSTLFSCCRNGLSNVGLIPLGLVLGGMGRAELQSQSRPSAFFSIRVTCAVLTAEHWSVSGAGAQISGALASHPLGSTARAGGKPGEGKDVWTTWYVWYARG